MKRFNTILIWALCACIGWILVVGWRSIAPDPMRAVFIQCRNGHGSVQFEADQILAYETVDGQHLVTHEKGGKVQKILISGAICQVEFAGGNR